MVDTKSSKRKYICIHRMDNVKGRTHGWLVCVQRKGVMYRKLFSDGRYGGKQEALVAAKKYRDVIIGQTDFLLLREFVEIIKSSNTSGRTGVARYFSWGKGNGPYPVKKYYWMASCPPVSGHRSRIKFYEHIYGPKEAKQMAIAARERAIRALGEARFDPVRKKRPKG